MADLESTTATAAGSGDSAKAPSKGASNSDMLGVAVDLVSNVMKIGKLNEYSDEVKKDFEFAKNQAIVTEKKVEGTQNLNMAMSGVSTDSFTDVIAESKANARMNRQELDRQEYLQQQAIYEEAQAASIGVFTDIIKLAGAA